MATSRPLLITTDPLLLDDVLRLAAVAGVEVEVAPDPAAARRPWSGAPVVLLGADLVAACAAARLPRRPQVVLVGRDLDDAGVWQRAVEVGAEHVIFLPDAEPWLAATLAEALEEPAPACPLVAVIAGRGGGGASVLASALAVSAVRRRLRVLLVDGDPLGGGLDLVFGAEAATGLRWPDLTATRGRVPGAALADALPRVQGLGLLSWDRGVAAPLGAEAVRAVLAAGRRTHDLLVVDLPRHRDDAAREVLESASTVLLVLPAEIRAVAAATRVVSDSLAACADVRVVVRVPGPTKLPPHQVAHSLRLPLAGELRAEPGLDLALERGEPPGQKLRSPLGVLCDRLLDTVVQAGNQAVA